MSDDITPGIIQVISYKFVGTGFVISNDGLLATCTHVLGQRLRQEEQPSFEGKTETC